MTDLADLLSKHALVRSEIIEYSYFEGDADYRREQRRQFIAGEIDTPRYDDDKLLTTDFAVKRRTIEAALLALESAEDELSLTAERQLVRGLYEEQLKRLAVGEAAQAMMIARADALSIETFRGAAEALYGPMDEALYLGLIDSETHQAAKIVPTDERTRRIQSELMELLQPVDTKGCTEPAVLDERDMALLHDYVMEHYRAVLATIPRTGDDVQYDTAACVEIMNRALLAGEMTGWKAAEDPAKMVPDTSYRNQTIWLPSGTSRTASELTRLIIHEQEAHARQMQNGINTGSAILAYGTAGSARFAEGLGVLMECAVAGSLHNPSHDRARYRYMTAGLAYGTDGSARNARAVYEIIWRMLALKTTVEGAVSDERLGWAKSTAMTHIENAFRGTPFSVPGVVYPKLKIYEEGLLLTMQFFKQHIDRLPEAFAIALRANYNYTDELERQLAHDAVREAALTKNYKHDRISATS